MKLASALSARADLQRRISELNIRLNNNAKVLEGEQPSEDPQALLQEYEADCRQLEKLITRINLTNAATVHNGKTLTEWIAKRDCLKKEIRDLRAFLDNASSRVERYSKTEIPVRSSVDVPALQKKVDAMSAELRQTDETIQEANWTIELKED